MRIAPDQRSIVITDVSGARLLRYDLDSLRPLETIPLDQGFRPTVVLELPGQRWFQVGTGLGLSTGRTGMLHDALLRDDLTDEQVAMLPRPAEYVGPLAGSVLFATGDHSGPWLYAVRNLIGTLYRFDLDGNLVDSMGIPPELFATSLIPAAPPGNGHPEAIREWVMDRPWLSGLRAISDSVLLVERRSWPPRSASRRRDYNSPEVIHLLIHWGIDPYIVALTPCGCRVLGAIGDTIVFQHGEIPEPITFARRLMSFPDDVRGRGRSTASAAPIP